MIEGLEIIAGDDRTDQALAALQGRALAQLLQFRVGHFAMGHDAASDDARSYRELMKNAARDHFQPMFDRTDVNPSSIEVDGAATAALKLAARLWAFADKAHRHADRLRAAEAARPQQED